MFFGSGRGECEAPGKEERLQLAGGVLVAGIQHGSSVRLSGVMIGKLGEQNFGSVFSGLGGFWGGAGLDR